MTINFPLNPKNYEKHIDLNGILWTFVTPAWSGEQAAFIVPTDGVFVFETTSAAESIQLPLVNGAGYNFVVDWGDGNTDTITAWDQVAKTHEYTLAGNYNVSIDGLCEQLSFALDVTSATKLTSVERLGNLGWTSLSGTFKGCTSLVSMQTHLTDISLVTDATSFLEGCTSLIAADFSGDFDSSTITLMISMFSGCIALTDLDLTVFDVSALTDATNFLLNSNAWDNTQYDAALLNWSAQAVQSNVVIHFGDAQYQNVAEKFILTDTFTWTITDGGVIP